MIQFYIKKISNIIEQPQEGKRYYGFNNKNEFTNKKNYILGIYNSDNELKTIFNNEQRIEFKKKIENYINDLESNDIIKIFDVINKLIQKNNINKNNYENVVRHLELINNGKISISNILFFLIKHYSLGEDFKNNLDY